MDKIKLLLGFSSKLLQLAQKGKETEQSLGSSMRLPGCARGHQ